MTCVNIDESRRPRSATVAARVASAGLLAATGAIHLDLYLTGYRYIPTIGWLFLAQVVTAFAFAVLLLATVRVADRPIGGAVAAGAAGFVLSTLGGYLISLQFGLFGFREVRTTAGIVAGVIEILAFVLAASEVRGLSMPTPRQARLAGAPLAVIIALLLVLAEVGNGPASASTPTAASSHAGGKATMTIVIKNFMFKPMDPRVTAGERIVVKNEDGVTHTFTASGRQLFNTGDIAANTSKVLAAPSGPGKYSFRCLIHQFMTGTMTVVASS